jgi:hypothetical protein
MDEEHLRSMSNRSWSLGGIGMAASGLVMCVAAVAMLLVAITVRLGPDATGGPPVGLFQSEDPVGTGRVGATTCVALRLTDEAYRVGTVQVWLWLVGPAGCRSSTSGVVPAPARITSVPLAAGRGLPERLGYRVDLEIQLLPGGSETIAFVLDTARNPGSQAIVAYKSAGASGSAVELTPVETITVDEPGAPPPPTPRQP